MNPLNTAINALKQQLGQGFAEDKQAFSASKDPESFVRNFGSLALGRTQKNLQKVVNNYPNSISFGGDMATVNPGGFAGALGGGKTIGAMQQAVQSPDLTQYENAMNTGNKSVMEHLASLHPGDARFLIHKTLELLGGGVK